VGPYHINGHFCFFLLPEAYRPIFSPRPPAPWWGFLCPPPLGPTSFFFGGCFFFSTTHTQPPPHPHTQLSHKLLFFITCFLATPCPVFGGGGGKGGVFLGRSQAPKWWRAGGGGGKGGPPPRKRAPPTGPREKVSRVFSQGTTCPPKGLWCGPETAAPPGKKWPKLEKAPAFCFWFSEHVAPGVGGVRKVPPPLQHYLGFSMKRPPLNLDHTKKKRIGLG